MKGLFKTAVAAAVIAGVAAQPHIHGHRHLHAKKDSPIAKRNTVVVTEVVEGPTVVEYVFEDGSKVDPSKAAKGIEEGSFLVVGSSTPTFTPPPPVASTSIVSLDHGGQFFEKSTTSAAPTTSSTPPPEPTTSAPPPPPPEEKKGPTGLDAEFPSGKIKCDNVPTEYGPIEIPWTGTNGWTTLAQFGGWIKGVAIDNIKSPITGTCSPGMMCSYACPVGYQKTQWPEEQGATGQSVGGLWCNDDGFLELTRPSHKTLCERGAGGVYVRNELSGSAAVCRTDYPGNEAMVIPIATSPGGTYELTNPDSSTYYKWKGMPTTAQYYVNNLDVSVEEACRWDSPKFPKSAGNWAPVNIGVGKSEAGETYISIFPNTPTTTAVLDFDIEITGDISGTCWLKSGTYSGNNGCTVGMKPGATATIVFKNSS
ncbi:Sperm-associated antigen 4 protein [Collariella sp. IMI 366227]|nr:Sperm-associated antigen 4 protein [Collariella sp. IMI 366227]